MTTFMPFESDMTQRAGHRRGTPQLSDRPVQVAMLVLPQALDASIGITLNILQTANILRAKGGRPDAMLLTLVSPLQSPVTSAGGQAIEVRPLHEARDADVILIPGALLDSAAGMIAWITQPWISEWLRFAPNAGLDRRHVAASCAGTWLLGEAGLLDGRQATTIWWLVPEFSLRYPSVHLDMRSMIVDDGNITTAGAALAHTDLVLHVIARWCGPELAEACSRYLLADQRQLQSRHIHLGWMAQRDPIMRRLQRWIEQHLADRVEVADLARAVNLTPRTLARRTQHALGMSPWRLVQRQRLEAAVHLLRTTRHPFEEVAARVGYIDASALRRLMTREINATPKSLRT